MLAPRQIPPVFSAWNAKWHAPSGRRTPNALPSWQRLNRFEAWRRGLFGFQPNNSTRAVEYPWAFYIAPVVPRLRVVELGGALSGFQFVLARSGADVTNVDPFLDYGDGPYRMDPAAIHANLNKCFSTNVKLRPTSLMAAHLPSESFDRIYCISTIEHLGDEEIKNTVREVARLLDDGGLFILTVDLFLNVLPFTPRARNEFGRNISLRDLIAESSLSIVYGVEDQLFGFDAFHPSDVLANLERYLIGDPYPALTQLLVLQKGMNRGAASIRHNVFAGFDDPTVNSITERWLDRAAWWRKRLRERLTASTA
jgi:SAM-dependent methyltransferase